MKKTFLFVLLLISLTCFSQGDQTIISVPIGSGATEQAILHLPDDYGKTSTSYPVMIFLHGDGEAGTSPATIYNSATAGGPSYFIATGKFPSSFINPKDKQAYKFIVVSPQSVVAGTSTTAVKLEYILTSLIKSYRIDTSRIYLTGLSAGGEGILEYVGKVDANGIKVPATHKIAAFIPMSAVMNAFYRPAYAKQIVADSVQIWGFGSATDTHGANTLSLVTWDINTNTKPGYGVSTAYDGGHCCWGQFYDPSFIQNGMNIYQWALQYRVGAVPVMPPPIVIPPVVVTQKVDSAGIIKAYVASHPCPVTDSAGIGKAYALAHPCPVCPPPVVCPVCPPQRTVVKMINDLVAGICYLVYSDGYTQQISK